MRNSAFEYSGSELEIFCEAKNWKSYWSNHVQQYLGQDVLEVGAGIGSTTQQLCTGQHEHWIALEPDARMALSLQKQRSLGQLPTCCEVVHGALETLAPDKYFETILYIDVLEHIEADFEEVQSASQRLVPGGYLVVLAPAHQWLHTPFDRAIGHYRRYDRRSLLRLAGENLSCMTVKYLDSVGMLASLANRLLLKTAHPSRKQIQIWDRYLVSASRLIDPILGYHIGKSILVVWQRL
jgi:SAM-dependent methyltransferase